MTRLGQECPWQGLREEGSSPGIPALPPSAIFGQDALGEGIWERSCESSGPGLSRRALGSWGGSVRHGVRAPGWRPLRRHHPGAIPKRAPAQTGKQCQPAGSVLPTDLACSSYFPLLSLAPAKEPARVLFALTLPVPSCPRSAGSPALGQAMLQQCLYPFPISWLCVMCSRSALTLKSLQPLPIRFMSFPS